MGVGAGIGVGGTAAIVSAIRASTVAFISGVGLGVAVGRASATAVLTSALTSVVGIGASPDPPHALNTNARVIATTQRTLICCPNDSYV